MSFRTTSVWTTGSPTPWGAGHDSLGGQLPEQGPNWDLTWNCQPESWSSIRAAESCLCCTLDFCHRHNLVAATYPSSSRAHRDFSISVLPQSPTATFWKAEYQNSLFYLCAVICSSLKSLPPCPQEHTDRFTSPFPLINLKYLYIPGQNLRTEDCQSCPSPPPPLLTVLKEHFLAWAGLPLCKTLWSSWFTKHLSRDFNRASPCWQSGSYSCLALHWKFPFVMITAGFHLLGFLFAFLQEQF